MNSGKYIETLQNHLLPIAQQWFGNNPWRLLQDGAPCHTSRMTKHFLEVSGIECVTWASYSPDMNPIEHVWNVLKMKLFKSGSGKTREEVIANATHLWMYDADIKTAAINCVLSMSQRVRELHAMKGGHTHY
jgi:hypothetical protein